MSHFLDPCGVTVERKDNAPTQVQRNGPLPRSPTFQGVKVQRPDCHQFPLVIGTVERIDDSTVPECDFVTPGADTHHLGAIAGFEMVVGELDLHHPLPSRASTHGRIMSITRSRGSASFFPSAPTG